MRAIWLSSMLLAVVLSWPLYGEEKAPDWVPAMKEVHGKFKGTSGTVAHFGDSITVSKAYWTPLAYEPKGFSEEMKKTHAAVKKYVKEDCLTEWKGSSYGNEGSMTIRWAYDNVETWLKKRNPEVVVLMFGTNDLGQVPLKEYDQKTRAVIDRCLANGTIVILTTLPPRSGKVQQSKQFADALRQIAKDKKIPLIDYQAEILKRRPDDWDGALPKFKDAPGDEYQVPTLIARDGVHPSNPGKFKEFTEEGLKTNGYMLRTYLTLQAYGDVLRQVLQPPRSDK
jgi:lysophospholipase L1-like esterase